jgi:hypothetical protein
MLLPMWTLLVEAVALLLPERATLTVLVNSSHSRSSQRKSEEITLRNSG